MTTREILIFGASGTLGRACSEELSSSGYESIPIGRDLGTLESVGQLDGAVWAQGANFTGELTATPSDTWEEIWNANFQFIVRSLEILLAKKSFNPGSRLVIISSVWQEIARPRKVAYIASKTAVGGLVRGLAAGTPTGALITPAQITKTVAFLIGPNSHGINGQSIIVDGGWSITRNV